MRISVRTRRECRKILISLLKNLYHDKKKKKASTKEKEKEEGRREKGEGREGTDVVNKYNTRRCGRE